MKVHHYPKLLMLGCLLLLTGCGEDQSDQTGTDSDTSAVSSESESQQEDEVVEFVDSYEKMFAPRKPKVGDVIEGVSAFDENGERFDIEQARGKPTVLVFGCLT